MGQNIIANSLATEKLDRYIHVVMLNKQSNTFNYLDYSDAMHIQLGIHYIAYSCMMIQWY